MKYIGSKNKLSKELVPIIQSYITEDTEGYLEPFVGGANMIDKIKCKNKIGYDIHKHLIALLNKVKEDCDSIPNEISEDTYNEVKNNKEKYPGWYLGLVGFCATFGAKYFGGYARSFKSDGITPRNQSAEGIRNLKKQVLNLKDIKFECKDFRDINKGVFKNHVIYCDIPYRGTTKYKTEIFPHEEFYEWVKEMSIHNTVLISEYNMPDDFTCIWQKEVKVNFDSNRKSNDEGNERIEKLYTYKVK